MESETENKFKELITNKLDWDIKSLIPIALFAGAFLTNPSSGDFELYIKNELGVLNLHDHRRHNYYIFSLYDVNSLSFRKGEDNRVVLGLFGQFVELNQRSTW